MLSEQKSINEELMGQMRQMQMQMKAMNQPGGSMQGGGNMGDYGRGGFANDDMGGYGNMSDYGGMGSGYGDGYGGGKMPQSFMGGRAMPYNMRVPKQPGDWDCPQCGNMNFAKRMRCNGPGGCSVERRPEFVRRGIEAPEGGPKQRRQGDWDCPKCQNINFSHRNRCNGKSSGVPCNLRKPEFEKFSVPFLRNKEMRQPGDWCCLRYLVSRIVNICFNILFLFRCGNINFPSRENCNKCEITKEDATNMEAYRYSPVTPSQSKQFNCQEGPQVFNKRIIKTLYFSKEGKKLGLSCAKLISS